MLSPIDFTRVNGLCANSSQEQYLMLIRGEGLADDQGRAAASSGKVMYVLHPNCPVEDIV
jgi:hypothetical protein